MPGRKTVAVLRAPRAGSGGFSLVEVLISVAVLSFGVLGLVGLHLSALQGNRDARQQSTAASLARELAEMIRGNKDVALAADAADNPFLGDFSGSPLKPPTTSECLLPGSSCPVDVNHPLPGQKEVARAEMTDWLARVEEALPGARVSVCHDGSPFDADGTPRWACNGGDLDNLVVKMGWSRQSTNRSGGNTAPVDRASLPSITLVVAPGSRQ